ncbi:MAG: hypothetical protein KDJ66_05920, partial [Nitratireductor sp.]|nr:hypothetical protein [Nitratireductor sp.]
MDGATHNRRGQGDQHWKSRLLRDRRTPNGNDTCNGTRLSMSRQYKIEAARAALPHVENGMR